MAQRLRLAIATAAVFAWGTCSAAWLLSDRRQDLVLYERPRPLSGHWQVTVRSDGGVLAVEFESKPADDTALTMDGTVPTEDGVAEGWLHLSFPAAADGNYSADDERWHGIRVGYRRDHLMLVGDAFGNVPAGFDGLDHRTRTLAMWCPYGAVWLPITIAVAWAVWRAWATRRRPGRCRSCGYDLRSSPDRCPECGALPAGSSPRISHG